jgi:hypothetical protein
MGSKLRTQQQAMQVQLSLGVGNGLSQLRQGHAVIGS